MTDFIQISSNPPPDNSNVAMIDAPDGAKLRVAFFPTANAIGAVVLMAGWSEFIEKYFEVINDLHARRFSVAMMDWRGQGLSDRKSQNATHWSGYFNTLRDDLECFTEDHVKPRFSGPTLLMTHSMGGLPALMLLASGYAGFERAVLCAPMTRLFSQPMNSVMGAVAHAACAVGFTHKPVASGNDDSMSFEGNMFTTDPVRHERFRALQIAEPAAALVSPTFGWVREAIRASKEIHRQDYFNALATPVKIISAGNEQRIDASDHEALATLNPLMESVSIPGALHEILMERDDIRNQYWREFDKFTAPSNAG